MGFVITLLKGAPGGSGIRSLCPTFLLELLCFKNIRFAGNVTQLCEVPRGKTPCVLNYLYLFDDMGGVEFAQSQHGVFV